VTVTVACDERHRPSCAIGGIVTCSRGLCVMTSPLVAVRELQVRLGHDEFRVELGMSRNSGEIVFLLRDNGNVVRGNALAYALRENGFGTAICHLLTDAERERAGQSHKAPLSSDLLARRLMAVVDAVGDEADPAVTSAGIVASGMAGAAAMRVAALRPLAFDAIVCRHAKFNSFRALPYVRAATLFLAIAGDLACTHPMTRAFQELQCVKRFELVSGGSTTFDEERSFRMATELTTTWMRKHVGHIASAVNPPSVQPTNVSSAITMIPPEINVV